MICAAPFMSNTVGLVEASHQISLLALIEACCGGTWPQRPASIRLLPKAIACQVVDVFLLGGSDVHELPRKNTSGCICVMSACHEALQLRQRHVSTMMPPTETLPVQAKAGRTRSLPRWLPPVSSKLWNSDAAAPPNNSSHKPCCPGTILAAPI